MKVANSTMHNEDDRANLAARISTLQPGSVPMWGKMTVGRPVLRRMLRPDKAMARNVPTMPALIPAVWCMNVA